MLKRKKPPQLWDYGLVYETSILNRIPRGQEQRTSNMLRMVGRWKSDKMFRYLHVQAHPIMNGLAAAMLNGGNISSRLLNNAPPRRRRLPP